MASVVNRLVRGETRESLDAGRGETAVLVEDRDRRIVGPAVGVGHRIAGLDRVVVLAILEAGGQAQWVAADAPVDAATEIEVERGLVEFQRAGVGRGRRLGEDAACRGRFVPPADVDRIALMEAEFAATVVDRHVPVPVLPEARSVADRQRAVLDGGDDVGQEAVRVKVRHRAAVFGTAEESAGIAFAARQSAEPVQLAGPDRYAAVEPQIRIRGIGVADLLRYARRIHARAVGAGAVGFPAVAVLDAEVEEAFVAQLEAGVDAAVQYLAVALVGLSGFERHPRLVGLAPEHDVDHARQRVRTVLRGGAIAQHLDALDGRDRDRVDVGARRTAGDGLLHVDQRLLVASLAVDQHQHLVGAERTQRGRAQDVGAVADRGAREVEARFEHLQDLADLLRAGAFELLAVDHVDRCGGLGGGTAAGARAEDLDGVEGDGFVRGVLVALDGRLLRLHRHCQRRPCQEQGQGQGDDAVKAMSILPLQAVGDLTHGVSLHRKNSKWAARFGGNCFVPLLAVDDTPVTALRCL